MQPDKIETKRLRLVGVEMYVRLEENFVHRLKRTVALKFLPEHLSRVLPI